MIIFQMAGGLGNQMFIYAMYKRMSQLGRNACIEDWTHYRHGVTPEIKEIFNIAYETASIDEYNRLTDSSMNILKRIKRKILGRKQIIYREKDAITYDDRIFDVQDCYVEGYFQSEKYFSQIKEILRKEFVFPKFEKKSKAYEYERQITQVNAVSVHVRRGDYLEDKFAKIYGNICTEEYYCAARNYMKNKYPDCKFYLFTNDAEWGRQQESEDTVYVDASEGAGAYVDMALMSCCKHHIIANSSFSWWGAWLDENPDKTVIAPAKWLNISEGKDIYAGLCNCLIDSEGKKLDEQKKYRKLY